MAYKHKSLKEAACEHRVIVRYLATVLKSPDVACDFIDEFEYQLGLVCDMPELYGLSCMKELAVLRYRLVRMKNTWRLTRWRGCRRGCPFSSAARLRKAGVAGVRKGRRTWSGAPLRAAAG